ncbi:5-(carboxyamino)imidazole ribonucleotide synthase [Planctomicrobium sp. SH668]|uniref:5-(carboxyamino)imidazole ribonucleotide synthase n=1 Tax=Planctomicrobium sp. SH668 TaxID=3448126 RepID=UPI003F5BE5E0
MTKAILPGATLGVLGSGQLGRMFAIAARQLGYGVQVYSPEGHSPTGQVADREWAGNWDDLPRLKEFASRVDVVTLEFENVPVNALLYLETFVPVRPGPKVLESAQNRLKEKTALRGFGLPTAEFAAINSLEELNATLNTFGGKGILKTASWGYDGKGQQMITPESDLAEIWSRFDGAEAILEKLVNFAFELSVIAVRNPAGEIACYAPILNHHQHHILDISVAGAPQITPELTRRAREIATVVMDKLDVIGVLCVEMFLTLDGELLINEIAPRPHNSGHLTIDAHATSQFEQQVRAICGLPLGSTELQQPAAMANLLGDIWPKDHPPRWEAVLRHHGVNLHLYGKAQARPGRKMGHLTCTADDAQTAEAAAIMARNELLS